MFEQKLIEVTRKYLLDYELQYKDIGIITDVISLFLLHLMIGNSFTISSQLVLISSTYVISLGLNNTQLDTSLPTGLPMSLLS